MGLRRVKHNLKNTRHLKSLEIQTGAILDLVDMVCDLNVPGGAGAAAAAKSNAGATPFYATRIIKLAGDNHKLTSSSPSSESRSAEMLFTTIKTTKMKNKRVNNGLGNKSSITHVYQVTDAFGNDACGADDANDNDRLAHLANIKHGSRTKNGLKGFSLKEIGTSIANIFKPSKRMANTKISSTPVAATVHRSIQHHHHQQQQQPQQTANGALVVAADAGNIIIDKSGVYIPQLNGSSIKITLESSQAIDTVNSQHHIGMKKTNSMIGTMAAQQPCMLPVNKSMSHLTHAGFETTMDELLNREERPLNNAARKAQPRMGLTAYSLAKSKQNILPMAEIAASSTNLAQEHVENQRLYRKNSTKSLACQRMQSFTMLQGQQTVVSSTTKPSSDYECLSNYHSNDLYAEFERRRGVTSTEAAAAVASSSSSSSLSSFTSSSTSSQSRMNHHKTETRRGHHTIDHNGNEMPHFNDYADEELHAFISTTATTTSGHLAPFLDAPRQNILSCSDESSQLVAEPAAPFPSQRSVLLNSSPPSSVSQFMSSTLRLTNVSSASTRAPANTHLIGVAEVRANTSPVESLTVRHALPKRGQAKRMKSQSQMDLSTTVSRRHTGTAV